MTTTWREALIQRATEKVAEWNALVEEYERVNDVVYSAPEYLDQLARLIVMEGGEPGAHRPVEYLPPRRHYKRIDWAP